MATVIDRLVIQGTAPTQAALRQEATISGLGPHHIRITSGKRIRKFAKNRRSSGKARPRLGKNGATLTADVIPLARGVKASDVVPFVKRLEYLGRIQQHSFGQSSIDTNDEDDKDDEPGFVIEVIPMTKTHGETATPGRSTYDERLYKHSTQLPQNHYDGEYKPNIDPAIQKFQHDQVENIIRNQGKMITPQTAFSGTDSVSLPSLTSIPSSKLSTRSAVPLSSIAETKGVKLELSGHGVSPNKADNQYQPISYENQQLLGSYFELYTRRTPRKKLLGDNKVPGFVCDPQKMDTCLTITKGAPKNNKHTEKLKLKHYTQYVAMKEQSSYNAFYPSTATICDGMGSSVGHAKNKRSKRYEFVDVSSYLNFNKFYDSCDDKQTMNRDKRMTLTVDNHPKCRYSSAKYSDIAVQHDLDDFFVVKTPTIPRRKSSTTQRRKAKQQIQFEEINDDEEKKEWAGTSVKEEASVDNV